MNRELAICQGKRDEEEAEGREREACVENRERDREDDVRREDLEKLWGSGQSRRREGDTSSLSSSASLS